MKKITSKIISVVATSALLTAIYIDSGPILNVMQVYFWVMLVIGLLAIPCVFIVSAAAPEKIDTSSLKYGRKFSAFMSTLNAFALAFVGFKFLAVAYAITCIVALVAGSIAIDAKEKSDKEQAGEDER